MAHDTVKDRRNVNEENIVSDACGFVVSMVPSISVEADYTAPLSRITLPVSVIVQQAFSTQPHQERI